MKIADASIMRKIDRYCIEDLGIPGIVLMENAALKLLSNIDINKSKTIVIVCGKGNNGGDGFALARHLVDKGVKLEVFMIDAYNKFSEDSEINYKILGNIGIDIKAIHNVEDVNELRESIIRSDITIDGIFGTGLTRQVEGIFDLVISIINENSKYIIAIDTPSGLNSNTGKILGNAIRANKTVTFQLYKKGFLNYDTDIYTGDVIVEDIGIPPQVVKKFHNNEYIMDSDMIKESLKKRNKYGHKGDYGKILIFSGSSGFTGAPIITSKAAVRSGSGLVTLCSSDEIFSVLQTKVLETMTIPLSKEDLVIQHIEKSDAIALGPGMGNNKSTMQVLEKVINKGKCPLVIDADGLNVMQDNLDILKKYNNSIVITPHLGEMARLTGLSVEYIRDNRLEVAKRFALDHKCIVLLKGYHSIITDGDTTIINPTGNSSMASGGMGDCLTGMIVSFIGQGYDALHAASIAAFIHGYCGEELSKDMYCVNASHIIEKIPYIIRNLQNDSCLI